MVFIFDDVEGFIIRFCLQGTKRTLTFYSSCFLLKAMSVVAELCSCVALGFYNILENLIYWIVYLQLNI